MLYSAIRWYYIITFITGNLSKINDWCIFFFFFFFSFAYTTSPAAVMKLVVFFRSSKPPYNFWWSGVAEGHCAIRSGWSLKLIFPPSTDGNKTRTCTFYSFYDQVLEWSHNQYLLASSTNWFHVNCIAIHYRCVY